MPHGVVELLASWIGKFNKLRSYGDLEYDPSLPHVGYLEGKEMHPILKGMKDRFMI